MFNGANKYSTNNKLKSNVFVFSMSSVQNNLKHYLFQSYTKKKGQKKTNIF